MAFAFIIAVIVALVALVAAARREREFRHMARFLRDRPQTSNSRVSVSMRSNGALDLANAMNDKLDDIQTERIQNAEREQELQRTLSALSHDIRTPLAAAQGYLQLLEEESDATAREHYVLAVDRRLTDVRQLLDELLLYAKAKDEAWQPECEPVDVGELLAETLASFYPQFTEKGWSPHVDLSPEPCVASTDAEALTRIFRNLTANALRHGVGAPRIVQKGKTVTFANRVENGADIDPERMFERFYRGDAARADRGTGLGLAIVAELCHALGATAKASVAGNAVSITITLP